MISNPAKWFVNGSNQFEFKYEGDKTLWHFSPYDNKLSKYMGTNVVFFADDKKHALDVLRRMFEFRIEAAKTYEKYKTGQKYISQSDEELLERNKSELHETFEFLTALKENKIKLTLAPTNQFYIVGWASNDTIL